MKLNAAQIEAIQAQLAIVKAEQERILQETDSVINVRLAQAWESEAQKAFQQSYMTIRANVLTQINDLIALFDKAHTMAAHHLTQVAVDLATMNASAV